MRIVCISDTHGSTPALPAGDLLLHAGDLTMSGSLKELRAATDWLRAQTHRYKCVVAGNHDFCLQNDRDAAEALLGGLTYLRDSSVTINGFRVYGSPWQPWFFDWAFNLQRGPEIAAKWKLIPSGVDILITHGPPKGILDSTKSMANVGCADLSTELKRIRPRLHVFGHIHEAYGQEVRDGTVYVNACVCTLAYEPTNRPIVVDLD